MLVKLYKIDGDHVLELTDDMLKYLGLEASDLLELRVEFVNGSIEIRNPRRLTFEEAKERTFHKLDKALHNLAK